MKTITLRKALVDALTQDSLRVVAAGIGVSKNRVARMISTPASITVGEIERLVKAFGLIIAARPSRK